MAVLLTGVGYIGAALASRFLERRERVVALENFSSTPRGAAASLAELPGFTLLEGDVADPAAVRRAFEALPTGEPAAVVHLAAQPSAAMAVRHPEVTERSNLVGARVVLEAARERGARAIFGGSFRVYGDDLAGATVDERTLYGRVGDLSHLSKVYVEQLARMLGLPFVSVRLGVVYGRSPVMKDVPAFMTVPNLFCLRAVHGEPLTVLEDRPMGFIHVADAARALLAALEMAAADPWQVVNAAPEVLSISEVARTVQRLANERGLAVEVQGAGDRPSTFAVRSRLEERGFRPEHAMATSLGDVLDYFQERAG